MMTDTRYTAEELATIQKYADEAEQGYEVTALIRRGRPSLGPAAHSVVVPVRITPALADALDAWSTEHHQSRSEAVRELLEQQLVSS
jgi:hypothetical protein